PKEELVQRTIEVLAAEYKFPLASIGRDVAVPIEINGRRSRKSCELVVFAPGAEKVLSNVVRLVIVQPPATKANDPRKGVELLRDVMGAVNSCEFGMWTNGRDISYQRKIERALGPEWQELSDFPGFNETLDDLERPDRRMARVAVTSDLRDTVLRCHDYLYGNQSMSGERSFLEMLKLIFCKIYDERRLRESSSYPRQFWVGVTERNGREGQEAIAARVHGLFSELQRDELMNDVFRAGTEIELQPKHLAWVAGEIARYNFLDADVDVKGMAYEAMVSTTMKREKGQFFTPRNVIHAMVEILAPRPGQRVLDPACGSGRFLVACLDRFRQQRAEELAHERGLTSPNEIHRLRNSREVIAEASNYARECLFGVDVDPELKRAAKMNMLINNDGHGNIFTANTLEITALDIAEGAFEGAEKLGFESFDVVLTNPPFGAKIPIDDENTLRGYDLARRFRKNEGGWQMLENSLRPKMPPEILFIERCLKFLKPGGRLGIVVPDGILGNPDNEPIRHWILSHARVLASIDLPVEAFLPQVGVQASLLFLEKKSETERAARGVGNYDIFMAVAEMVGHDRRGNDIFRRDPDGYDLFETYEEEFRFVDPRSGEEMLDTRQRKRRLLADDMPLIVRAYDEWRVGGGAPSLA
ncbi:MAG TPA: N-6 DNA methylase, partial [Abditibacteriaceae bacterium]